MAWAGRAMGVGQAIETSGRWTGENRLANSFNQPLGKTVRIKSKDQHARTRSMVGRFFRWELGFDSGLQLAPDDRCRISSHRLGRSVRPFRGPGVDHNACRPHTESLGKRIFDLDAAMIHSLTLTRRAQAGRGSQTSNSPLPGIAASPV